MTGFAIRRIVVLALCAVVTDAVRAQPLDADALLATVRALASPDFEGRRAGTPGGLKARNWIAGRFKAIGLAAVGGSYVLPFSFASRSVKGEGANLVGLCRGTAGSRDMIVVSAHYDHLGIRDGVLFPGADDNASGVAVMLGIAERCQRTPFLHDILFVAFDAEELGLQGAKVFVANPPVPKERVRLNINLDMVSRSDRRELYAAGTYHWPKTKPSLEEVARRASITLLFGHDKPAAAAGGLQDWTIQSDHAAFHLAGIPFVYFGVEDHADYHQPTDTPDKIDPVFLRDAAAAILDAVIALDRSVPFGA